MRFSLFVALGLLFSLAGWPLPPASSTIIQACTLGFMFVAGLECSFAGLRSRARTIGLISAGAFLVPFASGLALSYALGFETFSGRWVFATALSVSALPVIIQILSEQNLLREPIGQMVVSAASLCDVAAWLCFLLILPHDLQAGWVTSHVSVLLFLAGVCCRAWLNLPARVSHAAENLSRWIFAPVFLIGIGLQLDLWNSFSPLLICMTTAAATLTKLVGVRWAGKLARLPNRESWMMAAALNARGAVEILLAHMAFRAGLIDQTWLTTIIATAVLTSMIAGPWLGYLWRGHRLAETAKA